jgi:Fur family transcriptional regulator, ferric uptake regulator
MSEGTAVRSTRQRAAIAAALRSADGFRSAQELYGELRQAGGKVGLTTVYRTLQTLADQGEVDVLRTADGESVYRRCASDEHHHHLVCRSCAATVEIDGPEVEQWAAAVGEQHGFVDVTHTLEVFGLCGACARG